MVEYQKFRFSSSEKRCPVTIIQIRSKGSLTLPAELRRRYNMNEGDILTLVDLGDGCILLAPVYPSVEKLGDDISRILSDREITEDEMLRTLEDERKKYYQEKYGA
jgi:AbrB family looped-hinge helix DNA binding protein